MHAIANSERLGDAAMAATAGDLVKPRTLENGAGLLKKEVGVHRFDARLGKTVLRICLVAKGDAMIADVAARRHCNCDIDIGNLDAPQS